MLDEYRKRRDQLHAWLTADPRLRCRKPAGAFYMFVDISDALSPDGFRTSADFARGAARGAAGGGHAGRGVRRARHSIRISYATSMETAARRQPRLLAFVAQHAPQPAVGRIVESGVQLQPGLTGSMSKVVAVIGASSNRNKFGNRAVRAFQQQGYTVVPINPHEAEVEGLKSLRLGARRARSDRHGVVLRAAGDRRAGDRRGRAEGDSGSVAESRRRERRADRPRQGAPHSTDRRLQHRRHRPKSLRVSRSSFDHAILIPNAPRQPGPRRQRRPRRPTPRRPAETSATPEQPTSRRSAAAQPAPPQRRERSEHHRSEGHEHPEAHPDRQGPDGRPARPACASRS